MVAHSPVTGYIALVGRPNVGKSTLLNHLLGTKLSITSRKPQTTQHQILGVLNDENAQLIFIDTPGFKRGNPAGDSSLGGYIKKQSLSALSDVDLAVLVIDSRSWEAEDQYVLNQLKQQSLPVICVLNKIDRLARKQQILHRIKTVSEIHPFCAYVPTAAIHSEGLEPLIDEIKIRLPEREHLFERDDLTNRSSRFLVSEIVREQLFRQLGAELPYRSTVLVEQFIEENDKTVIHAIIVVEKNSQKGMVVGRNGRRLKTIGSAARANIEELLGGPVELFLRVRTQQNWTSDRSSLVTLGYR